MATKYAEILLAVRFRVTGEDGSYRGGPMYYIQRGLRAPGLAAVFSVLCALCALGIGNMAQVNAVSTAMDTAFGVPAWASGLAVAALVCLVVFGGVRRIARVTELVIPMVSILYLFGAGAFLWLHREGLADAFGLILREAFALRPMVGGAAGFGITRAMRYGLSRGVFTNEAGLGSAPIAHAAADCKSPRHQAVWGIFEVFLDTIVVCTITALVLLCAHGGRLWWNSGLDGAALTAAAFQSVFGMAGARFIAVSIFFFAVAAMLGWCYWRVRGGIPHRRRPVRPGSLPAAVRFMYPAGGDGGSHSGVGCLGFSQRTDGFAQYRRPIRPARAGRHQGSWQEYGRNSSSLIKYLENIKRRC